MNQTLHTLTHLASAALCAFALVGPAHAGDASAAKTREQVRAELAQAQRLGTLASLDHSGKTLRELQPQAYPAVAPMGGKTRAQVQAELAQAQRSGDLRANDESGRQLWEQQPNRYPAMPMGTGKTSAQVRAELAEAQRTGDLLANDDSGRKLSEVFPARYAAAQPMGASLMAASR